MGGLHIPASAPPCQPLTITLTARTMLWALQQTVVTGLKPLFPFITKQNHTLCFIYWELSESSFNYLGFFSFPLRFSKTHKPLNYSALHLHLLLHCNPWAEKGCCREINAFDNLPSTCVQNYAGKCQPSTRGYLCSHGLARDCCSKRAELVCWWFMTPEEPLERITTSQRDMSIILLPALFLGKGTLWAVGNSDPQLSYFGLECELCERTHQVPQPPPCGTLRP